MKDRYYISTRGINTLIVVLGIGFLLISTPVFFSGSWREAVFYFTPTILFLLTLWTCLTKGIYITIDEKNIYNTFFFVKRDTIKLSKIISLSERKAMLPLGKATQIWVTFYDKEEKILTRGLITKETLKSRDFDDLMEKIHKGNPNIKIQ